tara:strand:+ start:440 stop:688 length:249 start_codon:yes stop_codon:yes gene_type:complete
MEYVKAKFNGNGGTGVTFRENCSDDDGIIETGSSYRDIATLVSTIGGTSNGIIVTDQNGIVEMCFRWTGSNDITLTVVCFID